ncbi:MAG: hypothetical protein AYK22_03400 [Thermoplasmatales archaeon SG8-52-3]|nr:MAG: hypothetical protein AYK22_03400 [Thermoplasmatales archaeon SG8-52-3]
MLKLVYYKYKKFYIIFVLFLFFLNFYDLPTVADERGRPDLIIYDVDLPGNPPGYISEDDEVEFIVKIKNIKDPDTGEYGNISIGTEIVVALFIDGSLVYTNSTSEGLNVNEIRFVNLSWTAVMDSDIKRDITIEVDYPYPGNVIEIYEDNNFWDGFIYVSEKNPGLEIINIDIPDNIIVNKTVAIRSTIKNFGGATNDTIYAKLNSSIDGEVQTLTRSSSLSRNKTHNFTFIWKPSQFGTQKISIDIIYKDKTHDFEEITVIVEVEYLQWWDINWHYRYFLSVEGSGTVEVSFNFTKLLGELGISFQSFENETLKIIEYSPDGNFTSEVSKYIFKESASFNSVTSASGKLLWQIKGSSFEKFYCIYFDVSANLGTRTISEETIMNATGNASLGEFSFVDGWGIESVKPIDGSFAPVGGLIDLTVTTNARAENVTAFIYLDKNQSKNFYIYLNNFQDNTLWKSDDFSFDTDGDWTIIISSGDWTDYDAPEIKQSFFVGKPDIAIKNMSFSTNWAKTTTKIYIDDVVNITSGCVSYDANVEDVNVSLIITESKTSKVVYKEITEITIYMDIANYVYFSWNPKISGKFNVTITLDPDDVIDEINENNNRLIKQITVSGIPDLAIVDIIIPSYEIKEFDRVKIDIFIKNIGKGDASNYVLKLYIENAQGLMKYENEVDSELITIKSDSNNTFSLYWNSSKPGNWLVGAKVLVNDTKRDVDISNNRLLSEDILIVKAIERNPPVISNIIISPNSQEQGSSVSISATVTDSTGLNSVSVNITNPVGKIYNYVMGRTIENVFRYSFTNTNEVGRYSYNIIAVDNTRYRNTASKQGNFSIYKESTNPVISFFDAEPRVQLKGESVEITCLASDNLEIKTVIVSITTPTNEEYRRNLQYIKEDKYTYSSTYDTSGKYLFSIEVSDIANNIVKTDDKSFWITSDIDDKDDDGMPDWWEEKYNLDPEDPDDAKSDPDKDGLTNLEEYKNKSNPKKDIFSENAVYRLKENSLYLSGSIILFFVLFILSIFSRRRKP